MGGLALFLDARRPMNTHTPFGRLLAALALSCLVPQGVARAQQSVVEASSSDSASAIERELTATGFPLARARWVEEAPLVDGDVFNDPAYADAVAATGFRQNQPDEGRASSERTEVKIVYTDDTLYFGVVCYVEDTQTIIVADSRRDSSLTDTDSFRIIIDTYLDRQNGFVFGTNPAGVEYDGQVTNEGSGSGRMGGGGGGGAGGFRPGGGSQQQRGSGGGFNLNWDGAWQVSAKISEIGWTAEFAIPFRTLRYPTSEAQTWGLNFQRNIRNRNEEAFWAPLPRQFNLNRVSLAGQLQGIEVPPQRNLKLTPYVLGETVRRTAEQRTTSTGDFGADLKYSVTPSLTLDMTYNTDFAQVEVDEEQINLDRFNLFFPEKRPFFLENAGLFSVGQPGQIEIFFSRRIGIGASGDQIPILGGGRLSGKIGNNTNVGFLNMQTESVDTTGTASQNFTVARVRQDFASRSNFGAIVVNRQATGSLAGDRDSNRTFAVDGRLGIGQGGTITGFAAETDTPGAASLDTHAYGLSASHESERARLTLGYSEVGPNFNPEVGFYQRRGYRRMNAGVFTFFRPENFLGLHEIRPHARHTGLWNFETGLHRDAVHPHRYPLGVGERTRDPHRGESFQGGRVRAVRDLPGRRRPARCLRRYGSAAGGVDQPGCAVPRDPQQQHRWLLRWGPRAPQPGRLDACRRDAQRPAAVGLERHRPARWLLHHQPGEPPGVVFLHDPLVRPGPGPVQRPCRHLVVEPAVRAAVRREHRALRRLQRHPRPRPRQIQRRGTHPHRQIQLPLRPS